MAKCGAALPSTYRIAKLGERAERLALVYARTALSTLEPRTCTVQQQPPPIIVKDTRAFALGRRRTRPIRIRIRAEQLQGAALRLRVAATANKSRTRRRRAGNRRNLNCAREFASSAACLLVTRPTI